jgi:RNA polymerase sigma-70 factor (ECF subfamily)
MSVVDIRCPDLMFPDVADKVRALPVSGQRKASSKTGDDRRSFAQLVLPHLGDAHLLARWITGDRSAAEEVVQEASSRAFRAIRTAADASPRPWLLTIVRDCANTWLQKNQEKPLTSVDLHGVEDKQSGRASVYTSSDTTIITGTEAKHLEAAILALAAPLRETLVLRDILSLSYCEIAKITGASVGNVMSRIADARDRVIKTIGRKSS